MPKSQTVRTGYYVALCLAPGMAPRSCYIGLVNGVDEYGVRVNLVHWDDSLDMVVRETEDFFAPWASITSMLVCTEEEPSVHFLRDKVPKWQVGVESIRAAETSMGTKKAGKAQKEH